MTRSRLLMCGALVGMFVLFCVPSAVSKSLWVEIKPETIRVRLIARERPLPVSSFGRNTESFIAELQGKHDERQLVRLSFRFLHYEPTIPDSYLDYSMVHTFRVVRQRDCDVAALEVAKFADDQYASGAPRPNVQGSASLPCYVTTPRDYKGSHRSKR